MVKVKNLPISLRVEGLKESLVKICEENDVVFIGLFGSFARGNYRKKSDIDMLIKFEDGKKKSLLGLIGIENKLKRIFRRKIDLLTIESISSYIREEVLSSVKTIYER